MANVLVVKGHPFDETKSTTVQLLKTFMERYTQTHPDDHIEIVDVFADDIPCVDADLLTAFANPETLTEEQQHKLQQFNKYTEQFLNSDKIIIANPMWNLHIPAPLKSWIDTIVVARKTFKYTPEGPVGLAMGKKVMHLQSSGSSFNGNDPITHYLDAVFNYIGIDNIEHIYIDGHHSSDTSQIEKAEKEALVKAENF